MPNLSTGNYVIRNMTRDEIDFAVEMAQAEGWNPGLYDAECFYAADPQGFFIGLLDGEPISCISVVKWGATFGFLGFYIVRPEYRGQGFGLKIWEKGLAYLAGRDVGLDGVVEQVANYQKSGFRLAYTNTRYQGVVPARGEKRTETIVDLADIPFERVQAYDSALTPGPRPVFLRCWIRQPDCVALGVMQAGQLAGYTVLRQCGVGYKFGPLFADDESLAEALFQAACNRLPAGTQIFLDVPGQAENPAATVLARRYGMTEVFQAARMYRLQADAEVRLPLERWFGVTTFELG